MAIIMSDACTIKCVLASASALVSVINYTPREALKIVASFTIVRCL